MQIHIFTSRSCIIWRVLKSHIYYCLLQSFYQCFCGTKNRIQFIWLQGAVVEFDLRDNTSCVLGLRLFFVYNQPRNLICIASFKVGQPTKLLKTSLIFSSFSSCSPARIWKKMLKLIWNQTLTRIRDQRQLKS